VTLAPATWPAASSCTPTSVVPLVPEARASTAMSGGDGVETTTAPTVACAQPALELATGCGVGEAIAGVGAAAEPPFDAAASPGPLRGRGGDELATRGAGVRFGGSGVGAFATAIVAGRCSIETTSA